MRPTRLVTMILLTAMILPAGVFAARVVIPEETEIKVKFSPTVEVKSGKLQPGIELPITLAEDIKIGGKTIIEAGAEGKAKVLEITDSSRPGKPGFIKVGFVELGTKGEYKTADGSMIKLAGVAEDKGKSRKLLSWIFILGLFIKGSDGEIDTAAVYPAMIKETVILETK